ncbi:hypothetical protein H6G89_08475 [Oscillatoria sp. FACHB-1407]|uniref:hypothetical protein n=1 Tax=Oscillatoria sp. FACHB-1407 TaxID=2692847 RepID=UPI0016876514|nr:hypothetical protein [Oscillatoria sp. FACHB-1407]MBD2461075.1 hypothetical protein [Oscillatoria sp. FACHB-1407]
MTPQDITDTLETLFDLPVQVNGSESWQVEINNLRLLVLLSEDGSWLRSLISIASAEDAQPHLAQLMEANFDETQETRYALYEGVLWGVFQHNFESLTTEDFQAAIARLVTLQQRGLSVSFDQLAETQIRQIVRAAKLQGQSLETTLQTLDRFYREGVMGEIDQNAEQRQAVLGAWRYQLERFWNEEG